MIAAHPFEDAAYAIEVDGNPVCWTSTRDEADTDRAQRQALHPDAEIEIVEYRAEGAVDPDPVDPDIDPVEDDEES